MKKETRFYLIFSYITSLLLMAGLVYCILFLNLSYRDISIFKGLLIIAFILWLSVGHLSDILFHYKDLAMFRFVNKNIDKLVYIGCHFNKTYIDHTFYLVAKKELYYISAKEKISSITLKDDMCYRVAVSSRFSNKHYTYLTYPIITLLAINELKLYKALSLISQKENKLLQLDKFLVIKRISELNLNIKTLERQISIDEIIKDLENEKI